MEDITRLTVHELVEKLNKNELSSEEIVKAYKARIEDKEKDVKAFITTTLDEAEKEAVKVDEERKSGAKSSFAGVPIGIKDNLCTNGVKTTCASKMLENFVAPYDATVVEKLKEQDIISLGKLNMDEFAMGSTTETSAFGATKNPRNPEHVPGGSSGGSAAAVAANECFAALGSDTGGSIRQPASYCGVVGLKPTYGTVSRYGLIAYGSSLDQIGPLCKDVTDCATIMEAIAGKDDKDSTSIGRDDYSFTNALVDDVKGMRIGIPRDYFGEGLDPEVKEAVLNAAKVLESKGAIVEEFDLSLVEYAIPTYYTIAAAEASSNLERFDGVKYGYRTKEYEGLHNMYKKTRSEGFGAEVKRRIMLGTYVLSSGYYDAYYKKACLLRQNLIADFDDIFNTCDVLIAPTAPNTAFELGFEGASPVDMYLSDIATVPINITGVPAISVPVKNDKTNLPIGMQIIGKKFDEKKILDVAYFYEKLNKSEVEDFEGGVTL